MRDFRPALPDPQRRALVRARGIELLWLLILGSIIVLLYFTLGNSQAMKTAWIEDMLSMVPPVAFLVASWIEGWPPNDRFPLGFIRVTSIAYLISSAALASVGLFLLFEASMALIQAEHPTIGTFELAGTTIWFGWVMIAALAYSAVMPLIFGRLKLDPARQLHDKTLYADALMNKADWMTGGAAIGGILGIGMGWWWADAAAALIISLDVVHDGVKNTGAAIRDLIDEVPRTLDDSELEPLIDTIEAHMDALPWVAHASLLLRQEGRYLTGTVHVEALEAAVPTGRLEEAERDLLDLDWRIQKIAIMPRSNLAKTARP